MKKALFAAALLAGYCFTARPAQASTGYPPTYVAVATHTATAMVTAAQADGMFGVIIENDSATDNIRCGFDVSVSTVAGAATLGFKIAKGVTLFIGVGNVPYCKSESATTPTPTVVTPLK
jgi:hypothetical protein